MDKNHRGLRSPSMPFCGNDFYQSEHVMLMTWEERGIYLALLWHAWVGVRNILMDYVKPVGLRLALQVFTILWLVGCAGWTVQILWRV